MRLTDDNIMNLEKSFRKELCAEMFRHEAIIESQKSNLSTISLEPFLNSGVIPAQAARAQPISEWERRTHMSGKLVITLATTSLMLLGSNSANAAMTEAECQTRYTSIDSANHGYVMETEAPTYFAFYHMGNKQVTDGKLAKDVFLKDCATGFYDVAQADKDAPISGANSFTETQAKDRIVAHGGSVVSSLKKDDKGIWRGTATIDSTQQNVAVDYKGNVVFTK
ncbi:MAG: hypothetical protein ABJA10_05700 [Aestuariivirga sp.]